MILNLSYKPLTKIKNLPKSLIYFNCESNQITKIENLPESLKVFDCDSNSLTKIENLPENLKEFYCEDNPIQFVDNVSIQEYNNLFGDFYLYHYNLIKKIIKNKIKK